MKLKNTDLIVKSSCGKMIYYTLLTVKLLLILFTKVLKVIECQLISMNYLRHGYGECRGSGLRLLKGYMNREYNGSICSTRGAE